jgi:hypothetical protein
VVSGAVITTVITQTATSCLSKWGFVFLACAQTYYVRCIDSCGSDRSMSLYGIIKLITVNDGYFCAVITLSV